MNKLYLLNLESVSSHLTPQPSSYMFSFRSKSAFCKVTHGKVAKFLCDVTRRTGNPPATSKHKYFLFLMKTVDCISDSRFSE